MTKRVQQLYVALTVIACAVAMSWVDGVLRPGYAVKSAIKLALYLLIPLLYFLRHGEGRERLRALFRPKRGELRRWLALGGGVYALILGGYVLLRGVVDFSAIAGQLTANAGVGKDNFLLVSLYICFVNALLEEFFFRGYAFLTLKELWGRRGAYVFSAALFALYHVGMTDGWFNAGVSFLLLAGLFLAGTLFNRIDETSGNLYPSWLVHMCANLAINTVGFLLLNAG